MENINKNNKKEKIIINAYLHKKILENNGISISKNNNNKNKKIIK